MLLPINERMRAMTRDEIISMAREAGMSTLEYGDPRCVFVYHFAALVAAAEREACAKVCEEHEWPADIGWWIDATKKAVSVKSALECAAAIRARGEKGQS